MRMTLTAGFAVAMVGIVSGALVLAQGQGRGRGQTAPGGTAPTGRAAPARGTPGTEIYKLEDGYLDWPIAPSERAYAAIDGKHLHGYVKEITAISRAYRDKGHQYWGRIEGTTADLD